MNKLKIEDKLNYIYIGNKLIKIIDHIEDFDHLKWLSR